MTKSKLAQAMTPRIERTILSNLIHNEEFARKVIPFIKEEYFQDAIEKVIFKSIWRYAEEYKSTVTPAALAIEVKKTSLNDEQYRVSLEWLEGLPIEDVGFEWLTNETEQWCKDKAIYNAVLNSIHIIEGKDRDQTPDVLPSLLSDALSVSFDKHVGHDYMEQFEDRFEYYNRSESKISFDLDFFNRITKGGLPNKTLNIAIAGTGVGKSLFMCHMAASVMMQGKNALYITLEMAEERIAERVDANLMNVTMDDLHDLPKHMYESKFAKLQKKTQGKLIVKEYPTASAHCGHFRSLLNELMLKKDFKPDIVFVDYINICASSRFKAGANVNSYTYIKGIAEELRGLAVEFDLPIVSATQTTRTGFVSTDIGLEDTSESFGLPATADFMFALIQTEELEELNQILIKQLKNRYADPTANKKFIIGVDRAKMKLYDVNQTAQEDMVDNGQGEELIDRFADFKV
jgi:archaellum biogenesis ATPase FlaH